SSDLPRGSRLRTSRTRAGDPRAAPRGAFRADRGSGPSGSPSSRARRRARDESRNGAASLRATARRTAGGTRRAERSRPRARGSGGSSVSRDISRDPRASRLPWRVAPTAHAHYRAVETYTPQKNLRRRLERRARQGGTGMLAIALRLASGALLSTIFAAGAAAHHAFSTEFDAELTGEVRGEVVSVFWANPHIRYDVRVAREDGTAEVWELAPPGNLPTYRREGWHRDTIQPGYIVRASGNLGRDGAKRLYATCIELESGPEKGRRLGCANPTRTETEVAADPNARYTYTPADFPVDITGYWDNRYKFRQTADDLEPKPVPMTDEARAIYESRRFGDDDVLRCMPAGLPRIFGSPYPMEIFNA